MRKLPGTCFCNLALGRNPAQSTSGSWGCTRKAGQGAFLVNTGKTVLTVPARKPWTSLPVQVLDAFDSGGKELISQMLQTDKNRNRLAHVLVSCFLCPDLLGFNRESRDPAQGCAAHPGRGPECCGGPSG